MVKPLSKRDQLLSPSILTLAMFLGPLHWVSRLGFKKGTFWNVFRLWEPHPGMPVKVTLLTSEGSSLPSLLSPLFAFKLTFWVVLLRSFRQSFMRWSELPHLKQFQFIFWYSLTTLVKKTMYSSDWSAHLTPSVASGSSSSEDSNSSCLLCLCAQVFCNSIILYCSSSDGDNMTALQFLGGKQICWL